MPASRCRRAETIESEPLPVFSSNLLDYAALGIGRRIREERQRKQLTLRELANRVGISEAKLSNVETAKVSLDLAELSELAGALGVALPALVPRTGLRHHCVTRAAAVAASAVRGEAVAGSAAVDHYFGRPLADAFAGKQIDPVLLDVKPAEDADVRFVMHDHEEFIFVLRGEIETSLKTAGGVTTERLQAGDALYFRSNIPHMIRSATATPAEVLSVTYSLPGIDPYELGPEGRSHYRQDPYANATDEASEKIALLRRSHGLTLAELAGELNVGARQLAQIESRERSADVDLLLRLAQRFRRPIEYFFASTLEVQPAFFIQRADQIANVQVQMRKTRNLEGGTSANIYRPLAAGFPDRGMHPYYVQVTASARRDATPHEHHGQEFLYVLEGEVEFLAYDPEEVSEVLRPGDSLFLESSVPHLLRGHSRNPFASTHAEVIDVFWTPLGEAYLFGDPAGAMSTPEALAAERNSSS
jgi:transcriptional regulator with XRE-family HTH domain